MKDPPDGLQQREDGCIGAPAALRQGGKLAASLIGIQTAYALKS